MSQLNWQNVAAPDFSGSLQGFAQFGQLLNGALGGATKALDSYDQSITDAKSKQAIADILSTTDPKSLQDGSFFLTHPADRLNADALSLLARRPDDILGQQNKQLTLDAGRENFDFTKYDHTRTKADQAALDASKPIATALLQAGALGGTEADIAARRNAILSDPTNAKIFGGLNLAQQEALIKAPGDVLTQKFDLQKGALGVTAADLANQRTVVGIAGDKIANEAAGFNLKTSKWEFNNKVVEKADLDAANRASYITDGTYKDAAGAQAALEGIRGSLSPAAYAIVKAKINQQFGGDIYTGGASAGGGFSGAGGGGAINPTAEPWRMTVGGGQLPDNVRTIGDVIDYGKKVLIPGNKGKFGNPSNLGSSATGTYQLTGGLLEGKNGNGLAAQVFGANWRSVPFTPANQDKLAEANFNQVRNSPSDLKNQWSSLKKYSDAEVRAIGALPWSRARDIIVKGETNASAFSPALAAGQRQAELGGTNGTDRFSAAANATGEAPVNVALRLRGTKDAPGTFANVPATFITNQINKIIQASVVNGVAKINPTQAGQILEEALAPKNHTFWGQVNLGNGFQLDQATIDNRIHDATHAAGGFADRQQQQAAAANTAGNLQALQARAAASAAAADELRRQAATAPRMAIANKDRIFAQAEADQNAYNRALAQAGNQPTFAQDKPAPGVVDTILSSFIPGYGSRGR